MHYLPYTEGGIRHVSLSSIDIESPVPLLLQMFLTSLYLVPDHSQFPAHLLLGGRGGMNEKKKKKEIKKSVNLLP